jgi:hypothetical protein
MPRHAEDLELTRVLEQSRREAEVVVVVVVVVLVVLVVLVDP